MKRHNEVPFLRSIALYLFILLFSHVALHAQFYEYGQDAGTLKWNQVASEHYRLIYPRGIDSLAMSIADRLEYYYPYQARVLDTRHRSMPVVIHNESSFSNGVFVWAPRRLEIFTNPDPNGYPQDWLSQLALHEGRHAFQVSKLDQGFTRGLSFIAGEQALGAMVGFLPLWYLEGDAVDAETRFSRSGRGRLPSFEMGMKALLLEKGQRYSFSKALLGSYRDYVPNHYQLGYLMVRYGRRTYGDELWNDMEDYVARRPYTVLPTYISNRQYGIKSKQFLYNSALDFYGSHWDMTYKKRMISGYTDWSPAERKHYTHYRFPQVINDSTLVTLKSGIDRIPEFIFLYHDGKEERIFRPGSLNSGRFSYSSGRFVWDEWIPDWRWSNRNFSGIRMMDLSSGTVSSLGARTRYYAPALSNEGTRIAAIEQRTDHTFRLVILDLQGEVLQAMPSPGNHFIQHPAWMDGDTALVVTLNSKHGECIYSVQPESNSWNRIFNSGFNDISWPEVSGKHIFFSGTYSGIDNVYAYHFDTDSVYQVTGSEFGAFEPHVSGSGRLLAYSDYHADGYHAVTSAIDSSKWEPLSGPQERLEQIDYATTPLEEKIIAEADHIPPGNYDPRPYRKLFNAVNVHSWLPLWFDYLDPENALTFDRVPVSPGITLLSQNLLSTVIGQLGYEYRDGDHFLHTGVVLKGRVPVVEMDFQYGGEPQMYTLDGSEAPISGTNRFLFNSMVYVPIRFNTGKYITFLQPTIGWSYSTDYLPDADGENYESGTHRMLYRTYFTSYLRRGVKDIWPRFGVAGYASYRNAPFDRLNLGNIAAFSVSLYTPGPLKHQSLRFSYACQYQDPLRFFYGNLIEIARGLEPLNAYELKRWSVDYTFPLLYPDLNIEPLVYLKRIRANAWLDYMEGKDVVVRDPQPELADRDYLTCGIDLVTDLHFLRVSFPFSVGSRIIYLPETGTWKSELIFSVDVN